MATWLIINPISYFLIVMSTNLSVQMKGQGDEYSSFGLDNKLITMSKVGQKVGQEVGLML